MSYTENVRSLMLEELMLARARNARYSMRSYSLKIGISQSAVSEILSGKRTLTRKTAERILKALAKTEEQRREILGEAAPRSRYQNLDLDNFNLISEWHHFAILSLTETRNFKSSNEWMARRLGLPVTIVKTAVERLLRLGLLRRGKNRALLATGVSYAALSDVAHMALKKANRENLALAEAALEEIPAEERDFTAITLCFDPDRLEDARRMIKKFRRDFDRVMEAGPKKEVFKLCVQLFPLSKQEGRP